MSFSTPPNSWPTVCIGLLILAYWLRVLQMVARTRATVGRAANIVPPELLGRMVRIVWCPVVVLWGRVVGLWVVTPLVTPFLVNPPVFLRPLQALYGNRVLGWSAFGVA